MASTKQHYSTRGSKLLSSGHIRGPSTLNIHNHDLPEEIKETLKQDQRISVDTETTGLDFRRHKIAAIQLCTFSKDIHIVRFPDLDSKNLIDLFSNPKVTGSKPRSIVLHHMLFDIKFLKAHLIIENFISPAHLVCTKTLIKYLYPNTKSSLKFAIKNFLNIDIDKNIDHSLWKNKELTDRQIQYMCDDVLYLDQLATILLMSATSNYQKLKRYQKMINIIYDMAILSVEGYEDYIDYHSDEAEVKNYKINWWNKQLERKQNGR